MDAANKRDCGCEVVKKEERSSRAEKHNRGYLMVEDVRRRARKARDEGIPVG